MEVSYDLPVQKRLRIKGDYAIETDSSLWSCAGQSATRGEQSRIWTMPDLFGPSRTSLLRHGEVRPLLSKVSTSTSDSKPIQLDLIDGPACRPHM